MRTNVCSIKRSSGSLQERSARDKGHTGRARISTPDGNTTRATHVHERSTGIDWELEQRNDYTHADNLGNGLPYKEAVYGVASHTTRCIPNHSTRSKRHHERETRRVGSAGRTQMTQNVTAEQTHGAATHNKLARTRSGSEKEIHRQYTAIIPVRR